MQYHCLIVDDEKTLADSTAEYFNIFDVKTAAVYTKKECLSFLETHQVSLILLDINLDQDSGFALCKQIRETKDIPILFISARQSDDDVLMGLTIGGDDYIRKPYSLSILLAKVKVFLKRYHQEETEYRNGDLQILYAKHVVKVAKEPITLKAMEYKLLCYLVANRERVVTKEEIFENVWGDSITSDSTLNVHIHHLREKIEQDPNRPVQIKTVWGIGYQFEEYYEV